MTRHYLDSEPTNGTHTNGWRSGKCHISAFGSGELKSSDTDTEARY